MSSTARASSAGAPASWPSPPPPALLSRLVDVHFHPTDHPDFRDQFAASGELTCGLGCCMSSNLINQAWTTELHEAFHSKILPAYGLHPWFCHPVSLAASLPTKREHYDSVFPAQTLPNELYELLPEPQLFADILHDLERNLIEHPSALVGEIGLDKSFRLPSSGGYVAPHSMKPEQRDGVHFTEVKTPMAHQLAICEGQLDLAIKLGRPASVHCVGAQGPMVEMLARLKKRHGDHFAACNIDLHSFGGSVEVIKDLQKRYRNLYFSFSTAINQRSPRLRDNISAVADDRLLVESDMNSSIGSSDRLWEVTGIAADAKGWTAEHAVHQLECNWQSFASHLHGEPT